MRKLLGIVAMTVALGSQTSVIASEEELDALIVRVDGEASGIFVIEFLGDVAPSHVARVKDLARRGMYDGVVFHRVIDGFMAQTGDVKFGRADNLVLPMVGRGGSDLPDLAAEFSDIPYETGSVGMARSRHPDSANSQFFIMFDSAPFLNGNYTIFGKVVCGQSVVNDIRRGDEARNGLVENPDMIVSARVLGDLDMDDGLPEECS